MNTKPDNKTSRRQFLTNTGLIASGTLLPGTNLFAMDDNATPSSTLAEPYVHIYSKGDYGFMETNGIPNHATGQFPAHTDPYAIGDKIFTYSISLSPQKTPDGPIPISILNDFWRFGIAINGVPFDPSGPFWGEGWQVEVLSQASNKYLGIDFNNAHVQPYDIPDGPSLKQGEYHYHGFPREMFLQLFEQAMKNDIDKQMYLLGYAADGFPIYAPSAHSDPNDIDSLDKTIHSSYRLKAGNRQSISGEEFPTGQYDGTFVQDYEYVPGLGDLDECNGRDGVTPEYPEGTYHYFITHEFPYIPRFFKGIPHDPAFHHPRPPGIEQTPAILANYHRKQG